VAVGSVLRRCALSMCLALGACSVLDEERLQPLPTLFNTGGSGGGAMSGSGGQASTGSGGSGGVGGGGGAVSTGGNAGDAGPPDTDGGDETWCGDGLVSGSELCDTGIEAGEPGACPTECPPLTECVLRALNGSGCRAECVVLQAQCEDDDGCCPGNCMPSNDDDCSASCGDGVVQGENETCEPEPNVDAGEVMACPESCDDQDACTMDVMSGSAMNCNVACAYVEITALAAGDGCCPDGANTLTDPDCDPVCGNDVRERGEDCDGAGCNEACDLDYTADQRQCLDTYAVQNDACNLCLCTQCAELKLNCFEDTNEARGERCVDLQACVRESGCFDTTCFCGYIPGACIPPTGPCIPEVQAAAETTNAFDIEGRKTDADYAIGRSYALDVCRVNECDSVCN